MKAGWLLGGALVGALLLPAPAWAEGEETAAATPTPSETVSPTPSPTGSPTSPPAFTPPPSSSSAPAPSSVVTGTPASTPTPSATATKAGQSQQPAPRVTVYRTRPPQQPIKRPQTDEEPVKARVSVTGTPEATDPPVVGFSGPPSDWSPLSKALGMFGVGGLMVSVGGLLFMWTRRRAWAHGDNDIEVEHDPTVLHPVPADPWRFFAEPEDTLEMRLPN